MFKKLTRAAKTPVKVTVDITINSIERLPIQYGKVKVTWGRGDWRAGHWHETPAVPVTQGISLSILGRPAGIVSGRKGAG